MVEESVLRFVALLIPISLMAFASLVFYFEYKKQLLMLARRIKPPKKVNLNQEELEAHKKGIILVLSWALLLFGLTWTFQEMGWLGKDLNIPWIPLIIFFLGIGGLLNHYNLYYRKK